MCGERDGFGRRIMESSLLQSVLMKGARGSEGGRRVTEGERGLFERVSS